MTKSLDTTLVDAQSAARREALSRERAACFHCGESCPDDSFAKGGKTFCCNGCLIVHDLLTENGLGQFYELGESPGVRVPGATTTGQFAYLEEPALQQRLLDFTDGRTSRVTLHIPAIHCIACVWLLENLFRLHPGIGRSRVDFPKREVAISFTPETIRLSEVAALLSSIGYEPSLTLGETEKRKPVSTSKRQWLQIGVAGFAFGNIMLFSLPMYLGMDSFSGPLFQRIFGWLSLALAAPVLLYSAADYWRSALLSMRQRVLTLDLPIALGLAAIYGQSFFEIATGRGAGYCDSLTGLIFFLLSGRAFQQKTQDRLAFDRDYKSFFPLSVTRKSRGSVGAMEERVSLSQLQVGDHIILRNGELIPADSKLISGPAFIDYSFVTGESEPVEKQEGDYLYAGGQHMGAGIEAETVKPVSQSYLTSLWGHEAFQKSTDDNLNTLTNHYSRRFTPIVIGGALGAAVFWIGFGNAGRGLKAFISVLIVACPCALALAAPFTLGTAQRLLARFKVFLKNSLVLEQLAKVNAVVFDKTGTLTSATANAVRFVGALKLEPLSLTPALSRWERENPSQSSSDQTTGDHQAGVERNHADRSLFPLPEGEGQGEGGLTEDEARWIFSLTRHSTHPHSVRISESFGGRFFPEPVRSFLETPGCGVEGQVHGSEIWLGSRAWLESRGAGGEALTPLQLPPIGTPAGISVAPGSAASKLPEGRAPSAGGSIVHLAIDGTYRGAFTLSSTLRPDTEQLIRQLAARYEITLLSGDNEKEREHFRELFGDDARLNFNQSPLDKLGFIRRLQASGKTVMMVGDGLNDAGALKQSDVGVAVIEKAGAFSPASDVILEAANVPRLFEILMLSRRAARIVRWGFGISAAYNLIGVSIAAAGVLSPLVCAVLMPVSSISVVLFACGMTTWAARTVGLSPQTMRLGGN